MHLHTQLPGHCDLVIVLDVLQGPVGGGQIVGTWADKGMQAELGPPQPTLRGSQVQHGSPRPPLQAPPNAAALDTPAAPAAQPPAGFSPVPTPQSHRAS